MDNPKIAGWRPLDPTPENLEALKKTIKRQCGGCTACCFTFANEELKKPEFKWCQFAQKKVGCGCYATRPKECEYFYCHWMQGFFEEKDRPDKVGVVFDIEVCSHLMMASVLGMTQKDRPMTRVTQLFPGAAYRERAAKLIYELSFDMPVAIRGMGSHQNIDLVVYGNHFELRYVEYCPEPDEFVCWAEDPMGSQLIEELKGIPLEQRREMVTSAQKSKDKWGKSTVTVAHGKDFLVVQKPEVLDVPKLIE